MTNFDDAIKWAVNNIDMYQFDDYADWRKEVIANLHGGDRIKDNVNLNRGLEQAWINEFGSLHESPHGNKIKEPVEFEGTNRGQTFDNTPNYDEEGYAKPRPAPIPEENVILPPTGEAPTIPKPVFKPTPRPSGIRSVGSAIRSGFSRFLRVFRI